MRSFILSKKKLIWMTGYSQTCNWFFFWCVKKIESSGVPIWLLTQKKLFSHIVKNTTKSLYTTFERFFMTASSARSNIANFSLKKNLSSNGCKPIRVLTRTKSWTSANHLSIGYLLPNFQPHRSNFFAPPPPQRPGSKGVDTLGAPPPQTPPGGSCQ